MHYKNIIPGIFIDRPNRFTAHVEINGKTETVHVKNTGRAAELLLPGAAVWLTEPGTPGRKTRFDLVTVRKSSGILINIDSQAPNKAAGEWLAGRGFDRVIPEYGYGNSRIDFYMEKGEARCLMEVKGCTLEVDGIGYFPDAPTERGVRHLHELAAAAREGYHAAIAFVIQMNGITEVRPNTAVHPEFADALEDAKTAGVKVLMLPCHIETDGLAIIQQSAAGSSFPLLQ